MSLQVCGLELIVGYVLAFWYNWQHGFLTMLTALQMVVCASMIFAWASSKKTTLEVSFFDSSTFPAILRWQVDILFVAAITSVRMSKDRNCILVSSTDDTLRLMDKANGTLLNEYDWSIRHLLNLRQPKLTVFFRYKGHHHTDYRLRSAFSNDDAYVLSGSEDNKMYIWDLLEVCIHSTF
jgi:WD40 repeat protein